MERKSALMEQVRDGRLCISDERLWEEGDNGSATAPPRLIVSNGSHSCLNQISRFKPKTNTKSIVSIIGPQNVGQL